MEKPTISTASITRKLIPPEIPAKSAIQPTICGAIMPPNADIAIRRDMPEVLPFNKVPALAMLVG